MSMGLVSMLYSLFTKWKELLLQGLLAEVLSIVLYTFKVMFAKGLSEENEADNLYFSQSPGNTNLLTFSPIGKLL